MADNNDLVAHKYEGRKIGDVLENYSGDPSQYDFKRQHGNYEKIVEILQLFGISLTHIDEKKYVGYAAGRSPNWFTSLISFKVTGVDSTGADVFRWIKYDGLTAGGGRSTVLIGDVEMKTSEFISTDLVKLSILLTSGVIVTERRKKSLKNISNEL